MSAVAGVGTGGPVVPGEGGAVAGGGVAVEAVGVAVQAARPAAMRQATAAETIGACRSMAPNGW